LAANEVPEARSTSAGARQRGGAIQLLLLVPLVGTLIPSIYNRTDPTIDGIPFFYWYQMVWIPLSVVCTLIVYRAVRGRD
jgi:Protein of unknown function (DUF3311)